MEDVLSVYARPYDENFPVICMDEKPVQLFANARKSRRSKDGRIEYEDNEYIRNGTAAIFLFSEPLNGWRFADAQEHRTREDWAKQIKWLLDEQYLEPFPMSQIKEDESFKEPYTDAELQKLLKRPQSESWAEWRAWATINLLIATGVRASTVVNIKISDVDFEHNIIRLRKLKNRKQQFVPMSSSLNAALMDVILLPFTEKETRSALFL